MVDGRFLYFAVWRRRWPWLQVISEYVVEVLGSLGVFTLGGLAGSGFAAGRYVFVGYLGRSVISSLALLEKMAARVWSADSFSVSIPAKGLSGAGLCTAEMKPVRVALAASLETVFGIGVCFGNHLTVSAMRSARVSMMKAW